MVLFSFAMTLKVDVFREIALTKHFSIDTKSRATAKHLQDFGFTSIASKVIAKITLMVKATRILYILEVTIQLTKAEKDSSL